MLLFRAWFCVLLVAMTTTTHVSCLEHPLSLEIAEVLERVEHKLDNLQSRVADLEAQQKQNNRGIEAKLDTLHSKMDDMGQVLLVLVGNVQDKTTSAEPCSSFLCDNGECIDESLKCDNQNDCGDNTDENNCSKGAANVEVAAGHTCPTGFTMVGARQCLQYVQEEMTWAESEEECKRLGGTRLAHLEDTDITLVKPLITSHLSPWVGARQYGAGEGVGYQWTVTRTTVTMREDVHVMAKGNCVWLDHYNGKYVDEPCSEPITFLCEAAPVISI